MSLYVIQYTTIKIQIDYDPIFYILPCVFSYETLSLMKWIVSDINLHIIKGHKFWIIWYCILWVTCSQIQMIHNKWRLVVLVMVWMTNELILLKIHSLNFNQFTVIQEAKYDRTRFGRVRSGIPENCITTRPQSAFNGRFSKHGDWRVWFGFGLENVTNSTKETSKCKGNFKM